MGRPKANPNLPEYMVEVGSAYKIKRPIPEHAWSEFPELKGKARIKVVSLGTDEKSAKRRFLSEIEAIEARIERAAPKPLLPNHYTASFEPRLYNPDEIVEAIERWKSNRIEANRKFGRQRDLRELNGFEVIFEEFNGRDWVSHRLDGIRATAQRIINEQWHRTKGRYFVNFQALPFHETGEFDWYSAVPEFKQMFAQALACEGIHLSPDAPILDRAFAIEAFADAWSQVMKSELHWLCGSQLYRGAGDPVDEVVAPSSEKPQSVIATVKNAGKIETLSQLLDSYLQSEDRKNAGRKRTHWKLLLDNLGDIHPSACGAEHFNQLKIDMRKAPLVKSDAYRGLPLSNLIERKAEIEEKFGNVDPREPKTIFDYFCSYKAIFEHARILKVVSDNPLEGIMPPKPKSSKKIKAYSDQDIALIFSRPMFLGCDRVRTQKGRLWGYRQNSGSIIERDGRYFMPILALYSGARMEEIGGARVEDFKEQNGVWYLDLRERSLKTQNSKRIVPLHPKLLETDGIDFLGYLSECQQLGYEYLFPEFRPSPSEENDLKSEISALMDDELDEDDQLQDQDGEVIKMTAYYSKWFAAWCLGNKVRQKGKNFHSFRHTAKARLRLPDTNEHINDLITGHARSSSGAGYGGDDETVLSKLPELYQAICRIEYPTFPKLRKLKA